MTDFKKYLKNINPEYFINALNSRIKEYGETITNKEKELLEIEKKLIRANNLEEISDLQSDKFWAKRFIDKNKDKLRLIDDVLQELGSSIQFKKEWKVNKNETK